MFRLDSIHVIHINYCEAASFWGISAYPKIKWNAQLSTIKENNTLSDSTVCQPRSTGSRYDKLYPMRGTEDHNHCRDTTVINPGIPLASSSATGRCGSGNVQRAGVP